MIPTPLPHFELRFAEPTDVPLILQFIRDLADYEQLSHEVTATEAGLAESLFGSRKVAEVLLGYWQETPVSFALFFHNFSTFVGRPGIYLEDLFVKPAARGQGIGRIMIAYLARLTQERNGGRLEWSVLDWNQPAINFYKKCGATPMSEWTVFRVAGQPLVDLWQEFEQKSSEVVN